jgi:hypothetical protein
MSLAALTSLMQIGDRCSSADCSKTAVYVPSLVMQHSFSWLTHLPCWSRHPIKSIE